MEQLLSSALSDFAMTCGAISFFDTDHEHIHVDRGYNMVCIPRYASFAAHALPSADVFVIEDTLKVRSMSCVYSSCKLTCNRIGALEAIL